jgi:large subunit ribosomal protein L18
MYRRLKNTWKKNPKLAARLKRKISIRKRISGSEQQPRLTVFRSAKHIYVQVIDDASGKTLAAASSQDKQLSSEKMAKKDLATRVGELVAKRCQESGINSVVFDRNGFRYHGRVKAIAEGAREGGLSF